MHCTTTDVSGWVVDAQRLGRPCTVLACACLDGRVISLTRRCSVAHSIHTAPLLQAALDNVSNKVGGAGGAQGGAEATALDPFRCGLLCCAVLCCAVLCCAALRFAVLRSLAPSCTAATSLNYALALRELLRRARLH